MGLIRAILKHGVSELNLNDATGTYHLGRDFVPPPVSLTANLAHGTSANRLGGAELVSTKAVNRNLPFSVHVSGESEAEIRNAISLLDSFIRRGTKSDPVFLHVRGSEDVGFEPLWGQFGADLRYEIVFGRATVSSSYTFGFVRQEELPACGVNLDIKPFAIGLKQRVGSATGGILEDTIGVTDGLSRGVIIPIAQTNKMTNPIFGNATWDNGWTTGSDLIASENIDEKFITHGKSSAKLVRSGPTNNRFTQSINVGNTNTHVISCYMKKPDGSIISESVDARLVYSGFATATITSEGDGWYRLAATVTGIASGTVTGVELFAGKTVYIDGFQIEEAGFAKPLIHGDLLGCSWGGTVHASTSTRVAARLRAHQDPTNGVQAIDIAEGTFRVVWKPDYVNTELSTDRYLFDSDGLGDESSFFGRWESAGDTWEFHDGTNTITGPADTFAVNEIIVLHFVYEPGRLEIYKNGVSIVSGSTYTPPNLETGQTSGLYIGTNDAAGAHIGGTFMDFTTFAQAMTATEVSDDRDNILRQVEDDRRLSPIPWLWTKDGDDIVDNVDDSGRDNWYVVSGVPGSAPAKPRWKLTASTNKKGHTMALAAIDYDDFRLPTLPQYYGEEQGTVEGSSSGGELNRNTVGTSETVISAAMEPDLLESMEGVTHFFARMKETSATGNLQLAPQFGYDAGGLATIVGEFVNVDITASYKLFYLGSLDVRAVNILDADVRRLIYDIRAVRTSGSGSLDLDYFLVVPGEVMIIQSDGANNIPTYFIDDREVMGLNGANRFNGSFIGDFIEPKPDKANILWHAVSDRDDTHLLTATTTIDYLYVTPRWALL